MMPEINWKLVSPCNTFPIQMDWAIMGDLGESVQWCILIQLFIDSA